MSFYFAARSQLSSLLRRLWIVSVVLIFGFDQGELGAKADETIVGPVVGEIVEPIVEMEEQVIAPVIDMEKDIAMLFGDGDFSDDDSEGFEDEEESFTLLAPGFPIPPSVIEDLNTRMGNLEYGHGQLVKNVIQVSDAEVADVITIEDIGLRLSAVEGHVQVMVSQMVQVVDRLEQAVVQQRNVQIQQLQTIVFEMNSHESTLMQCILGMDRRLADLERRPSRPQ
ncbi:hypothetical protein Tco_1147624 [Tanacetum coccineum]